MAVDRIFLTGGQEIRRSFVFSGGPCCAPELLFRIFECQLSSGALGVAVSGSRAGRGLKKRCGAIVYGTSIASGTTVVPQCNTSSAFFPSTTGK